MTVQSRKFPKVMTAGLLLGAMVLGACQEREVVLAGKRENVRSVLQDPALQAPLDQTNIVNESRPISLGAQQNNASWTHSTGTAQYRVSHPALRSAPVLAWSAKIGAGEGRKHRITTDPVVASGRIFTVDSQTVVTATSTSGEMLWSRDLAPPAERAGESSGGGLAVEGNTLYVSLGYGVLFALDVANGATRWSQKLEASGTGTPTVSGDLVYLSAGDNRGWALNKTDGRVEWQVDSPASYRNVIGAPAPAVTSKYAIFAFGSGEVRGVFRQGGLSRWTTSVVGSRPGRASGLLSDVTSAPVVSGDKVYVGNQSGRLSALSVSSGERLWTARDGALGPVWPAGDSIFAITDLNELVRMDASDGRRIWGVALPNLVKDRPKRQSEIFAHYGPIIAGGRLIVASNDGVLRSYSPTDGALVGTTEIPAGATTVPVVAAGTLYLVSTKGQLLAYR